MNDLPHIKTPIVFQQELKRLHGLRKDGNIKMKRTYRLTKEERKLIYLKTAGKCHVCGQEILIDKFEADHVKSYSSGGTSVTDNFLPSCKTCNNYRWHYLPEEFQWILKLGVWARTEVENNTDVGKLIGSLFIKREKIRENRRKNPRAF